MFFSESPLFSSGGRSNYRIPTIVSANDGTIHAFCNDRHDSLADHAEETALVYARKKPGQAWEAVKTLDAIPGWCCLIGSAVYDGETDTVFCTVLRKPVAIDEFGTFTEDEIRQKEEEAKKKPLP